MSISKHDVINEVVKYFMEKNKYFTSVDISNAIKKKGYWIRNCEISKFLHDNLIHLNSILSCNYIITQIKVRNGAMNASLYHPITSDYEYYSDTNQMAMSYDEFTKRYKKDGIESFDSTSSSTSCKDRKNEPVKEDGKTIILEDGTRVDFKFFC